MIKLSSLSPYPLETRDQKIDYIIEVREGYPGRQYLSEIPEMAKDKEYLEWIAPDRNGTFSELSSLTEGELDGHLAAAQNEIAYRLDDACRHINIDSLAGWAQKDAWSPAEALCLWVGLDPRFGNELICWAEKDKRLAVGAAEISIRWDLITRALSVGEITAPLRPRLFLNWAKSKYGIDPFFSSYLAGEAPAEVASESENRLLKANRELELDIIRLQGLLEELNQPRYKLAVKLFGAVCAGMYGHKLPQRNRSTALIVKIAGMFIENYPASESVTRGYIREAILELDKGDVEKLASIYEEEAKKIGSPTPLDRNFPSRP